MEGNGELPIWRIGEILQLHLNLTKTKLMHKSFSNSGVLLWNALPPTIRNAPNISVFKSRYLAHLKYP